MAFDVAYKSTSGVGGNFTNLIWNLPAGISAGDLILIFWTQSGANTPVDPAGYTEIGTVGSGGVLMFRVLYKVAVGTEGGTSITCNNGGATRSAADAVVLSGTNIDDASPILSVATFLQTAGAGETNHNPPDITLTANAVVVGGACNRAGAVVQSWTPPTGYVEVVDRDASGSGGKAQTVAYLGAAGTLTEQLSGTVVGDEGTFNSTTGTGAGSSASATVAIRTIALARVTKTTATTWGTRARVAKTTATTWTARSRVAKTTATTWTARARVTSTTATTWSTRARVAKTTATTWNTAGSLTRIAKTTSTTWAVRARVAKTAATTWTARARVIKTTATTWTARSRVAKTAGATSWNIDEGPLLHPTFPIYISHRGGAGILPPETVEAFQAPVNAQFMLEADVYVCSTDGVSTVEQRMCLSHDSDLSLLPFYQSDGTTAITSGSIFSTTIAQWDTYRVPDPLAGTKPFTARWVDIAAWIAANNRSIALESKHTGAVQAIIDSTLARGLQHHVLANSFTYSHCQSFAAAGLHTMWITTSFATNSAATVAAAGIEWVAWQAGTAGFTSFLAAAHAAGLKVSVYTVDSSTQRDSYIAQGADSIVTDRPDVVNGNTTRVTKTTATTWKVRERPAKTQSTTWTARARVAKTTEATWTTCRRIAATSSTTWTVCRRVVGTEAATSWGIRVRPTKTCSTSWNVRARSIKTCETTWTTHARTAKTCGSTWGIRQRVNATCATTWTVEGRVAKTTATSWSIAILQVDTKVVSIVDHSRIVYITDRSDS